MFHRMKRQPLFSPGNPPNIYIFLNLHILIDSDLSLFQLKLKRYSFLTKDRPRTAARPRDLRCRTTASSFGGQ